MVDAALSIRIVSCLMVLTGLLVVRGADSPESIRYRQVLMVPLAIAGIGLGLVVLRTPIPAATGNLVYDLFLSGLDVVGRAICDGPLFDLLFCVAFALVKSLCLTMCGWWEKGLVRAFRPQIELFYVHDEEAEQWFLTKGAASLRDLARRVWHASVIVALVAAFCFAGTGGVHPCFIPLVLLELSSFLGGRTKREYESTLTYEAGYARTIFGYANLEQALRHYFGERLLVSASRGKRHATAEGNTDLCASLLASPNPNDRICGAYFEALLKGGLIGLGGDNAGCYDAMVHDRVIDTTRLMRGQSVLFATPFYGDYVPYVFLPVNTTLLRGGHVVVLTGSSAAKRAMPAYVEEGISFVTNVPDLWEVGELAQDGSATPDVALLSFGELDDITFLTANEEYLAQVGMCLVIDPSSLLATYQVGLTMLAERMAVGGTPTYCVFDRNADGLVDSLSHALRVNLVEVGATDYADGTSFGLFWEVDGPQLQNRLMPGVARYLGVGTELGLVALHEQVPRITWAGRDSVPLIDLRWLVGQYYAEMFDYAELPQEQGEVDRRFEFVEEPSSLARARRRFMVVEDEHNNMFETYRQFSTRGSEESFVNVLAPNYLMRAYMAENSRVFAADPKAVPAVAPDVSKAPRNAVYAIVMTMLQTGEKMSEDDIAARLRYAGVSFTDAGDALAGLMVDYFSDAGGDRPESHLVCDERDTFQSATGRMKRSRFYGLTATAQAARPFRGLRNVPLITELPDGTRQQVGSRLFDLVYQSWLAGQFVTIDGKYYEVVSISDTNGVLLRRAADHFSSRRYYRQLRSYELELLEERTRPDSTTTFAAVTAQVMCANIAVSTYGYLDMSDYGDVAEARRVAVTSVPARRLVGKDVLRIELAGSDASVTRTIAVVLSELMVTLFPKDHQYLAVLTPTAGPLPEGILHQLVGYGATDNVIFVVEDSSIDIGLVSAVWRSLGRIMETCFEYLDWHEEMLNASAFSGGAIDPGEPPEDTHEAGDKPYEEPARSLIQRLLERLRDLLERKGKDKNKDRGKDKGSGNANDGAGHPEGGTPGSAGGVSSGDASGKGASGGDAAVPNGEPAIPGTGTKSTKDDDKYQQGDSNDGQAGGA